MIRHFSFLPTLYGSDLDRAIEIHKANGLDERCFPALRIKDAHGKEIDNPLFVAKKVYELDDGRVPMMCFLKVTSELYLLLDHRVGTPEERWEQLKQFKDYMVSVAWDQGLDQMTAYIPTDLEKSFAPRLEEMGFVKSPWQSYTLNV